MADNTVTVSGMFGEGKTYFAGSPVVIDIAGLEWPKNGGNPTSPFNIVRTKVIYGGNVVGDFHEDTGGQPTATFDIKSALKSAWAGYDFSGEVSKANAALSGNSPQEYARAMREYSLRIYTEYLASDDGGVFTTTDCGEFAGGQCLLGGLTEWERYQITDESKRDVSALEHTGVRNGDASTKPTSSPERVGRNSITSWVDVQAGYTKSIFYPAPQSATLPGITGSTDDVAGSQSGWTGHSPKVLRDSVPYTDFLFVNRRGAVETCSAQMLEGMNIDVNTEQYAYVGRPSFRPSRSLASEASGGRRSWPMSSGHQTREWTEWWVMEFLMAKRHWMLYKGAYVPVTVEPGKKSTVIYDRTKQQMPSVEFTVTLALEG